MNRDKEYYLHVKLKSTANNGCDDLPGCNNSFAHRDDNTDMFLYDWMFDAHVDTSKGCVKYKDDTKIDTVDCYSDNRQLCLVKCIPGTPDVFVRNT